MVDFSKVNVKEYQERKKLSDDMADKAMSIISSRKGFNLFSLDGDLVQEIHLELADAFRDMLRGYKQAPPQETKNQGE